MEGRSNLAISGLCAEPLVYPEVSQRPKTHTGFQFIPWRTWKQGDYSSERARFVGILWLNATSEKAELAVSPYPAKTYGAFWRRAPDSNWDVLADGSFQDCCSTIVPALQKRQERACLNRDCQNRCLENGVRGIKPRKISIKEVSYC